MNFNWTKKLSRVFSVIAAVWMFMLAFLITSDVIGRAVFGHPVTGTPELAANSIAMIAFLQIPFAIANGAQLRVTALSDKLSPGRKKIHSLVINLLGVFFFILISVSQLKYAISSWKILEYEGEGALRVPVYPVRTIIVLCAFFAAFEFFKLCIKRKPTAKGGR